MKQKETYAHWLKYSLARAAKVHFLLVIAYVAQLVVYDASKLITPEALLNRWFAIGTVTIVAAIVWYLARSSRQNASLYKYLTIALILVDICFAAFNVYDQRGMASRAVVLFFIPIVLSSILLSRIALFTTAIVAIVAYTTACIAYFVNYFNEGYKVELYGEVFFYSAMMLVVSALLWSVIKMKRHAG
jgi:hypothetical protein